MAFDLPGILNPFDPRSTASAIRSIVNRLNQPIQESALWARAAGVVADGVADDTAAVQAAVSAYLDDPAGVAGLAFPPGLIRITDTINFPLSEGWMMSGTGRSPGWDTLGHRALMRGTSFLWGGGADRPMFNLDGCSGFRMENFALVGSPGLSAVPHGVSGIRLQNRPGVGSGTGLIAHVSTSWLDRGLDIGTMIPDDGDGTHTKTGADTITVVDWHAYRCNTGFHSNYDQNVGFAFMGAAFLGVTDCFYLKRGGQVTAAHVLTFDSTRLCRVGAGGVAMSNTFTGVKCDGTAVGIVLYEADSALANPCDTRFIDVSINNGQLLLTRNPRFRLRRMHTVTLQGGNNLAGGDLLGRGGSGALFECNGGGTFKADGARLPSTGAGAIDTTKVVGAVSGGYSYRLRDCRNDDYEAGAGDYEYLPDIAIP